MYFSIPIGGRQNRRVVTRGEKDWGRREAKGLKPTATRPGAATRSAVQMPNYLSSCTPEDDTVLLISVTPI